MPRYKVEHPYASGPAHQRIGPWEPGQEMELSAEEADRVNRDSPGTLTPVAAKPKTKAEPEPEAAAEDAPEEPKRQQRTARDRQQRGSRNRGAT